VGGSTWLESLSLLALSHSVSARSNGPRRAYARPPPRISRTREMTLAGARVGFERLAIHAQTRIIWFPPR
jgi:hypothetical protein